MAINTCNYLSTSLGCLTTTTGNFSRFLWNEVTRISSSFIFHGQGEASVLSSYFRQYNVISVFPKNIPQFLSAVLTVHLSGLYPEPYHEVGPPIQLGSEWKKSHRVTSPRSGYFKTPQLLASCCCCFFFLYEANRESDRKCEIWLWLYYTSTATLSYQPFSSSVGGSTRSIRASDMLSAESSPMTATPIALATRGRSAWSDTSRVTAMWTQSTDPFAAMLTTSWISCILRLVVATT